MAQTLGALKMSKCATSCLHERTSTSKKEDCPETQSTKSTKNTSLEPPSPTFIFWACKKKWFPSTFCQPSWHFVHACPAAIFPFSILFLQRIYRTFHHGTVSGSWFWMENALNRIAWSGNVAGSVSSVPLPLTVPPLASQVVDWSFCLVGWMVGWLVGRLDGWLVEEHYNYTCVRWWPRLGMNVTCFLTTTVSLNKH